MTAQYHINAKKGEPGLCKAVQGKCPFGSETVHYSTAQEARVAFEHAQGSSFELPVELHPRDPLATPPLTPQELKRRSPEEWGKSAETAREQVGILSAQLSELKKEELRLLAPAGYWAGPTPSNWDPTSLKKAKELEEAMASVRTKLNQALMVERMAATARLMLNRAGKVSQHEIQTMSA